MPQRKVLNTFDHTMDVMYDCVICGKDTPAFYCDKCKADLKLVNYQKGSSHRKRRKGY